MPALGEGIIEATVLNWLKKPGERVEEEEMVLEIATDKVDSEVPSTATGIIKEVLFKENEVAPVGATIAIIDSDGELSTAPEPKVAEQQPVTEPAEVQVKAATEDSSAAVPYVPAPAAASPATHNQPATGEGNNGFYSPLVMSIAAKEGIPLQELASIPGTGNEGRLTKKDLLSYLQNKGAGNAAPPAHEARQVAAAAPAPAALATFNGESDIIEMDRMRKLIAKHMKDSQNTNATVTSFAEADVTNMVKWREKVKKDFETREHTKITFTPLFIDCIVRSIKKFPMLNSSVVGDQIIIKKNIHMGMAAALPNGNLIVPVIKNADHLNLVGLSKAVNDLAERARNNQLKPADTQEGTFTLTNVGSFGSLGGTPIINQPQVAILAVGTIKKRPVVIETEMGDTIGIRHMMFLSMSYDHRVIDGALGSRFLDHVVKEIEGWDPEKKY